MKYIIATLFIATCHLALSQDLRTALVNQLKNSHNNAAWFVPANAAVAELTAEQASWKDGSGNHSVGQLVHHIVFWNERALTNLKGQKNPEFGGSNDETFDSFDKKTWDDLVKRLDAVMIGFETFVQEAPEAVLIEVAPLIANISSHNAYHTGQIIFVRKLQKSWNPEKGVK
jgi:uncharacterized damage-inducible protein DinB